MPSVAETMSTICIVLVVPCQATVLASCRVETSSLKTMPSSIDMEATRSLLCSSTRSFLFSSSADGSLFSFAASALSGSSSGGGHSASMILVCIADTGAATAGAGDAAGAAVGKRGAAGACRRWYCSLSRTVPFHWIFLPELVMTGRAEESSWVRALFILALIVGDERVRITTIAWSSRIVVSMVWRTENGGMFAIKYVH